MLITLAVFTLLFFAGRGVLKTLYPQGYSDFVETYASQNNIEENLLYAVIKTESSFNPEAVSYAGAMGLTQILPETFTWLQTKTGEKLSTEELFTPEVSIKYGAFFYGMLMEKYGDVETAAAAYHAGMGSVAKWLGDERYSADGKTLDRVPYADTQSYIEKITAAKIVYDRLYG